MEIGISSLRRTLKGNWSFQRMWSGALFKEGFLNRSSSMSRCVVVMSAQAPCFSHLFFSLLLCSGNTILKSEFGLKVVMYILLWLPVQS